jgi:hypothetical protein
MIHQNTEQVQHKQSRKLELDWGVQGNYLEVII